MKPLILAFDVDEFDVNVLNTKTSDELYKIAKKNLDDGITDIYVLDEFCGDLNDERFGTENWFVYPHYVEDAESDNWRK